MTKKERELIKQKYNGRCAYSGTPLKEDWQVDHVYPIQRNWWNGTCMHKEWDTIDNMVPCQRIINHYKGSLDLELFRTWYLGGLHERLRKLPKNPTTPKGMRRKVYLLEVAELFGITEDKPFSGKFYFETLKTN